MYNIIALIGEAGTGKDTILRHLMQRTLQSQTAEIVSCTTRPKREGEVDGVNYYFLTPSEFLSKVLKGDMLEATEFNNWFYGTSIDSLSSTRLNFGVFNPDGIRNLINNQAGLKFSLKVYRINTSPKTRLLRQLNREDSPDVNEIIRRYTTDKIDFEDLDFHYTILNNETQEDLEKAISTIINDCGLLDTKAKVN